MRTVLDLCEQEAVDLYLSDPTEESFRCLFHAVSPRVLSFFRVRGCDRSLAEDLLQEVMLAVYTQSRRLRNPQLFSPWLFKIARNALLQHLRHEQRQPAAGVVASGEVCGATGSLEDPVIAHSCINKWISILKPDEREILLLRYVEGLAYHEIASVMNLPLGTVQWKIFHSKRKLAARFGAPPV